MLHRPQLSGARMHGGALRVAMAHGPDRGEPAAIGEGIVRRNAAVGRDPVDLAVMAVGILGRGPVPPLAHGHEQRAVRREGEPRAEMPAAGLVRGHAQHGAQVVQDQFLPVQHGAGDDGVRRPVRRRGGMGQVDQPGARKVGRKRHVQQPALSAGGDGRQALDVEPLAALDQRQAAGAFGDQHGAGLREVGQESERPGMFESGADDRDLHEAGGAVEHLGFGRLGEQSRRDDGRERFRGRTSNHV